MTSRVSPDNNNAPPMAFENSHRDAMPVGTIEERVQQLESKLGAQEKSNAGLRNDLNALKELLNGDRKENQESSAYFYGKAKQLTGLFDGVKVDITTLKEQQKGMSTKAELQTLSKQLDDLRTHIGCTANGLHSSYPPHDTSHTSGSPPAGDLIAFAPNGAQVNSSEENQSPNCAQMKADGRARASPPIEQGDREVPQLSSRSAPPCLVENRHHEEDQDEPPQKRVKFDPNTKHTDTIPSDPGSVDHVVPDATLQRKKLNKRMKTKNTSPLEPKVLSKSPQRKASVALDRFKSGRLDDESDDEDQIVFRVPASDDTGSTLVVATKAVTSVREAQLTQLVEKAATLTARSQLEVVAERTAGKASVVEKRTHPQKSVAKKPARTQQPTAMKRPDPQQSTVKASSQTQQSAANPPSRPQQIAAKKQAQTQPPAAQVASPLQQSAAKKPTDRQQVASERRSSRAPKPRDFGDVQVHGWKYQTKKP